MGPAIWGCALLCCIIGWTEAAQLTVKGEFAGIVLPNFDDVVRKAEEVVKTHGAAASRFPKEPLHGMRLLEKNNRLSPEGLNVSLSTLVERLYLETVKNNNKFNKEKMERFISTTAGRILDPMATTFRVGANQLLPIKLCPFQLSLACPSTNRYRTIDGHCNNIAHWLWGRSNTAMTRLLDPDYGDGFNSPRGTNPLGSASTLPSARHISNIVFEQSSSKRHPALTLLHMSFGQYIDHDIGRTGLEGIPTGYPGTTTASVQCGSNGCDTAGSINAACFPIPVAASDTITPQPCLKFIRTAAVPGSNVGCLISQRQQLNQITSYLDASNVYGSITSEANFLRDLSDSSRGQLKVTAHPSDPNLKPLLPKDPSTTAECKNTVTGSTCFKAGDARVNEQIGLSSLHTVFHREHNRIENHLHQLNPSWTGQILYQETRRIIGAMWQRIVFNEWLPLVIGPSYMNSYDLNLRQLGYSTDYDASVNGGAINGFQTGAMRYGHSEVTDQIGLKNNQYSNKRNVELVNAFFNPDELFNTASQAYSGVDSVMFGQVSEMPEKAEKLLVENIRNKLFADPNTLTGGLDLGALNIQRGRDHGLPGYNQWRKYCGFGLATSFNHFTDIPAAVRTELSTAYGGNVDDVDLYAGGIAETHVSGGTVGPTFACIIGEQFQHVKKGDRFWHETNNYYIRFTAAQLAEIRKITLARILCNNLDHVDTLQKRVLLKPYSEAIVGASAADQNLIDSLYSCDKNERGPCCDIPEMDLNPWNPTVNQASSILTKG